MSPKSNDNHKFIGGLCGFGMTWILIMVLMIGDLTEYKKRKVEGDIPGGFPIVVRVDDRAQIVFGSQLSEYLKEHPNYSFLIPEDQTGKFNDHIESNTWGKLDSPNIDPKSCDECDAFFTVKSIVPGKQTFKVRASCNEDVWNVGFYEATDKDVEPQYHTHYFGPSLAFKEAPIAGLITLAIWIVVPSLIRRFRHRFTTPVKEPVN